MYLFSLWVTIFLWATIFNKVIVIVILSKSLSTVITPDTKSLLQAQPVIPPVSSGELSPQIC